MKTQIGYVMQFDGHGAFAPSGRVAMTAEESAEHNRQIAAVEVENMKASGRAVLYLNKRTVGNLDTPGTRWNVGTWGSSHVWPVDYSSTSWHNMAGKDGRTDVWFTALGARWHGVNIGNYDIVRCRRVKS